MKLITIYDQIPCKWSSPNKQTLHLNVHLLNNLECLIDQLEGCAMQELKKEWKIIRYMSFGPHLTIALFFWHWGALFVKMTEQAWHLAENYRHIRSRILYKPRCYISYFWMPLTCATISACFRQMRETGFALYSGARILHSKLKVSSNLQCYRSLECRISGVAEWNP